MMEPARFTDCCGAQVTPAVLTCPKCGGPALLAPVRARARPQGKHQREVMAQLRRQPQNSYPFPPGTDNAGIARRAAIRRLEEKGLAVVEGDRYRTAR